MASVKDEWLKVLCMWAEARDANAPAVGPTGSGTTGAHKLPRHLPPTLLVSAEVGTGAHSIVGNTKKITVSGRGVGLNMPTR